MSEQRSGPSPRVLLVEDEPDIAAVVREALEPEGYEVVYAPTLTAASKALRAGRFDLVLTDGLSSDRAQAWDNARAVLAMAGGTPVVLFTAHRVDAEAACAAGFRAVIEKPFDLDGFLAHVWALLPHCYLHLEGSSPCTY